MDIVQAESTFRSVQDQLVQGGKRGHGAGSNGVQEPNDLSLILMTRGTLLLTVPPADGELARLTCWGGVQPLGVRATGSNRPGAGAAVNAVDRMFAKSDHLLKGPLMLSKAKGPFPFTPRM